jgi:hypothetical protein
MYLKMAAIKIVKGHKDKGKIVPVCAMMECGEVEV